MAQTGDPTGTGTGGSDLPDLKAEFSATPHKRGTVSMARTADLNSANSQFFICFVAAPWLDRQYSVWGQVVEGMEHIDAVKKGGEHNNGVIAGEPDKILKARIEADSPHLR
jgi:peptidyl-prolyl cis-trans isomerase B (cyclophilin B)